ncbi:Atp-binding protein, partial [Globisporangium polare]
MVHPTDGTTTDDEQKQLSYESAKTLMAHGPHVLHDHVAT